SRSLAEVYERLGRWDRAAERIAGQLELAREKVERLSLLRRLAAIYDDRLADRHSLERVCRQLLAELPGDRDALNRLATAYERALPATTGELISVLELHLGTAATPAEKAQIGRRLATLYQAGGEWARAAEALERVAKLDKDDLHVAEALGRAYEQLGRFGD